MTLTLRPAEAGDLMIIGDLHTRSRRSAYRDIVPADALTAEPADALGRWWVERWTWERDTHAMTVAERDGRLIGFTYVGPHSLDPVGYGELYAIHLEPDQQGSGTGRALMIDALETLRQRGWGRAALWVLTGNAHARRFYERGGWITDGIARIGNIGPTDTPQVRYVRDLR